MKFYDVHESASPLPKSFRSLFDIWLSGQTMLPEVVRWKPWVEIQGTRRQNTLQHTYALTSLTIELCMRLRPYVPLDMVMMLMAVTVHDHGEGELKRDVLLCNKTDEKDLQEYLSVADRFGGSPMFEMYHKAFLLQFAGKPPMNFPKEARETFDYLQRIFPDEILAFQALENLDYLMYAIEQSLILGKRDCLAAVLPHSRQILDRLSGLLPGLKEEFWTPELITYCETMAKGGNPAIPK